MLWIHSSSVSKPKFVCDKINVWYL